MFIEISQNSQESLFFNRVAGWIFIKNEALAHLPYCEFCETSTNCFFTEHLQEIASRNSKTIHTAKVYYKFFYSAWKETTQIPSKLATAKNPFSSVYNIVTTCFDKWFFILCDNWHRYPEVLYNRHVLALFEARDSKEVRTLFFISKSSVLIPKWKVPKWSSGMSYLLHFSFSCFFTNKMFQNLKISRVAGFF